MLSRLRIGPKLLLAPAMVLLLLIMSSSAAYYAMVRQNTAFEIIVHERAARIRDANELLGEARQLHANVYQLLTWLGASFAEPRVALLEREIAARNSTIGERFAALAVATRASKGELDLLLHSRSAYGEYRQSVLDVLELSRVDHSMSANAMSKAEQAFDVVEANLDALAQLEQSLSERARTQTQLDFFRLSIGLPMLVALSVVLSLLITMVVRRALLAEVAAIGSAAAELARGDLTAPARTYGRDEIAETSRALDASIRNLNRSLKHIRESSRSIDSASRDSAEATSKLAELPRLAPVLTRLKARSRRVNDLAGVVGKLACQTNLLALNAAAASGEHELAQRMRELALRSAAAAGEIGDLAGQSIAEVEAGAVAQLQVAEGGVPSVTPFDQMSRDNCALVQDAAASARGLQEQALALSLAVASFKLDDGGQGTGGKVAAQETALAQTGDSAELPVHSHLRLATVRV